MSIPLISNFDLKSALPIDSRMVIENESGLNSIPNKYIGMVVYAKDTQLLFCLKNNDYWKKVSFFDSEIQGGGGGGGSLYNFYIDSSIPVELQLSGLPTGIVVGNTINLLYEDNYNNYTFQPTIMIEYAGKSSGNVYSIDHPYYQYKGLQKINLINTQEKETYSYYTFSGNYNLDLSLEAKRNNVYNLSFAIDKNSSEYKICLPNINSGVLISDRLLFSVDAIYTKDLTLDLDTQLQTTYINFYTNNFTNKIYTKNYITNDDKIEFIFDGLDWKLRYSSEVFQHEHNYDIYDINGLPEYIKNNDFSEYIEIKYNSEIPFNSFLSTSGDNKFLGNKVLSNEDGNILFVNNTGDNSLLVFTGTQIDGWYLKQKLISGTNINNKSFARSFSTNSDGSILLVSQSTGISIYAYEQVIIYTGDVDNGWKIKHILNQNLDRRKYGSSIANNSNGSIIFVGAPDVGASNFGAVYVYTGDVENYTWSNAQTLTGDYTIGTNFVNDRFGTSICTDTFGEIVFIGGLDNNGTGAVWIYTGNSDPFVPFQFKQKLQDTGANSIINFGRTISTNQDGSILFVGAPNYASGNGRVYIYTGSYSDTWVLQDIISGDISPNNSGDNFGMVLANDAYGSTLFVGGTGDKNGVNRGAVWGYTGSNTEKWSLKFKINGSGGQSFGNSIGTDYYGQFLAIGDSFNINNSGTGIVHIYNNFDQTEFNSLNFSVRPNVNGVPVLLQGETPFGVDAGSIVYITGNQTIGGLKTFSTRPEINGSGVLLQGEAAAGSVSNVVFTTGDQTISGAKIFSTGGGAYLKSESIYTNSSSVLKLSDNPSNTAQLPLNILYLNSVSPFETAQSNVNTTGIKIYWNFTNDNQKELSRHIRTQNVTFQTGSNPYFGPWITVAENIQNSTGIIIPGNPSISIGAKALFSNYPLEDRLRHIETNGVFSLLSGEKMGVGIHNPSEKLHVVGNFKLEGELQSTKRPFINGTGVLLSGEANLGSVSELYISESSGIISGFNLINYSGYYDGGIFLKETKISQNNNKLINIGKNWKTLSINASSFNCVDISSDGKYQTVAETNGQIYISNDYGKTWATRTNFYNLSWYDIAMSSDGKRQTAVADGDYIYISNDYGNTWVAKGLIKSWYGIAMSSDGKYQTAVSYTPFGQSNLYVSNDYGNNWVPRGPTLEFAKIAMSSDGKYQTATTINQNIYISNNYGTTWVAKGLIKSWFGIAMSSDGKYQTAVAAGDYIYISNNYGNTWTAKGSIADFRGVTISSDGKHQTTVIYDGGIYISNDYGNNWTIINKNDLWTSVRMSSDGKYQIACTEFGNGVYISIADEIIDGNFTADNIYGNNIIYTTGNQTISGIKTFSTRPQVNGSGIILQGEGVSQTDLSSTVRITGNQQVSGTKTFLTNSVLYSGVNINFNNTTNVNFSGKISIGCNHIIQDSGGIILGGEENKLLLSQSTNSLSFIGNGYRNVLSGAGVNAILNGSCNTIKSINIRGQDVVFSTILNGNLNDIIGYSPRSLIGNGVCNKICSSKDSFIGIGCRNVIGSGNIGGTCDSIILGGSYNIINNTSNSLIGNGVSNLLGFATGNEDNLKTTNYSSIIGGSNNRIIGDFNFIGGGSFNKITGDYYRTVSCEYSIVKSNVIVGGANNTITDVGCSAILGGRYNQINHHGATVIGDGSYNIKTSRGDNTLLLSFQNGIYLETFSSMVYANKISGSFILNNIEPISPQPGEIYFNQSDNNFYGYNGTSWVRLNN